MALRETISAVAPKPATKRSAAFKRDNSANSIRIGNNMTIAEGQLRMLAGE